MLIDKKQTSPQEGIALVREIFGPKITYFESCACNHLLEMEKREQARRITGFMKMKLQHTMFVQMEGMNILKMLEDAAFKYPQEQALIDSSLDSVSTQQAYQLVKKYIHFYNKALLWHDLGRVDEFDESLKPTGINHAVKSSEILEKKKIDPMIILIVRNHGYPTNSQMYEICKKEPAYADFSAEEKKACLLLSLMVRDADKLGNWKAFVRQGINREITQRIKPAMFRPQVSISPYEMSCIRKNIPIDYARYTNFSGVQLAHLMWSVDMAFKATKKAAIEGMWVEGMLDYMNEVAQDDTAIFVKQNKVDALSDYQLFLKQIKEIFVLFQEHGWISSQKELDISHILKSFLKRLETANFDMPRVLTNGLKRYVDLQDNLI